MLIIPETGISDEQKEKLIALNEKFLKRYNDEIASDTDHKFESEGFLMDRSLKKQSDLQKWLWQEVYTIMTGDDDNEA